MGQRVPVSGPQSPPGTWLGAPRATAVGAVVLAFIAIVCLGTLPYTLGAGGPDDRLNEGTARYKLGDSRAARLPPWWVAPDDEEIRRLHALADPSGVLSPEAARVRWPRYWMGTDHVGRSLLIRVLAGGGISLLIGIAAALISVSIGTLYGALAGYAGGKTDALLMRVVDVLYGLPYVLLVVLLAVAGDALLDGAVAEHARVTGWRRAVLGFVVDGRPAFEVGILLVAIGGVSWLTMARVVRGQVLSLKSRPFMEAARALGIPWRRQFSRHLLPNLVGPIVVYATLTVPQAILQESFLSFLGIGVKPPLPSWGNLAADGLGELNAYKSHWWLLAFPCGLLAVTLLSLNFVGEGLRGSFDPKAVGRRARPRPTGASMGNRFGFKDFLLFVLVIAVGILVYLAMKQDDRRWRATQEANAVLREQEQRLISIQRQIDALNGKGNGAEEVTQALERGANGQTEALSKLASELAAINTRVAELIRATSTGSDAVKQELAEAQRLAAEREEELRQRIDAVQRGLAARPTAASGTPAPSAPAAAGRDESWARPGVSVTWASPLRFASPPRDEPGFAPGGTFVEVLEGQPATITPYRYGDIYGRRVVEHVCESLGSYDPVSLEMDGLLAAAWQYDPDGMWLRVRIHDDARFSDGAPVTAADVRFTFHDFIFNMEIEAERFRGTYTGIERVDVLADRVVEFVFREKRFDNLFQAFQFPVLPRHVYTGFSPLEINQSTGLLVGSGPFKLARTDPHAQWTPPDDVVLVRNEAYWAGPELTAPLERLRFRVISDGIARLAAYENGTADMIRPTPEQFRMKADDPGFTAKHQALDWFNIQSGYRFIAWQCGERNGKLTPFHDVRVRRAMTFLIDRERILRDIDRGLGAVATGPFNPATPQADPAIKPWPYDPGRADRLLAEAGWVDRNRDGVLENAAREDFRFELIYAVGSESMERMARYVKDQCAAAGIRCVLDKRDWATVQPILKARNFDAITFSLVPSVPEADPNQLWHSSQIDSGGDNWVQWRTPDADRLIEAGRREVDDGARMEIWHQLHRVIHDEQPYTFLVDLPWLRFVNRRVENVHPYPKGLEIREMFIRADNQRLLE